MALFLLYPVLNVLASSFGGAGTRGASGWAVFFREAKYLAALGNTILLGLAVTFTSALIGVPLAYFAARFDFPGKAMVAVLPLTTLVVPR